jgi:3-hydroxyisobutyrate dehydrogenase-like beta-hydroxyacid dehydrogenase
MEIMSKTKMAVWTGGLECDAWFECLHRDDHRVEIEHVKSPSEAQFVLTACRNGAELEALLLGERGVLSTLRRDATLIDFTWIGEALSKDIAHAAHTAKVGYVRSPLTRGPGENDTVPVTALLSGPRDVVSACTAIIECVAQKIIVFGESDEARTMTCVLDVVSGITMGMWAEALVFGKSVDLDWREMVEVMETSAIASPLIKTHATPVAGRQFDSPIRCADMRDRLGDAVTLGKSLGVVMSLTGIAHQMFLGTVRSVSEEQGLTAVIPWLESVAGV